MLTPLQRKALATLDNNRRIKKTKYTPPSPDHYPNGYLWDSEFVAIVYAKLGETEKAIQEMEQVFSWQNKKTGFIPNMKLGRGRYFDPEKLTFMHPDLASNYTQPPLHARACWEIFKSAGRKKGLAFLKQNYTSLYLAYKYFMDFRENSNSTLIAIIHPHETGRDSDPTFDFVKLRLPNNGTKTLKLIRFINSGLDYVSALFLNVRLRLIRWNTNKVKRSKMFWVYDVMFNCIYADNLYYLSKIANILGKKRDSKFIIKKAKQVSSDILITLWDSKEKMFYAKNRDGKFIKKISISNLSPIILPNIKSFQAESILALLTNKKAFKTLYPIPSVPANSKDFDPGYSEKRLWRGTTWINTNWLITEGLIIQAARFKKSKNNLSKNLIDTAENIIDKSIRLVQKNGFWEFYNPLSGKGLRINNFAWSTLAAIMKQNI